jgi:hypothetical protein
VGLLWRGTFHPFSVLSESLPNAIPLKALKLFIEREPAEILGSNPTEGMDVCCECCVLSGTGFCVGLITHPE